MIFLPVTKRSPDWSCLRNTTRFPANAPARRIKTVPGVMDGLILGVLCALVVVVASFFGFCFLFLSFLKRCLLL